MRINTSYEDGPTYFNYQIAEVQLYTYTPEPTSLALLGLGALGLLARRSRGEGGLRRRRARS